MKIRILFFASVRDIVGNKELEWEVPKGATVGQLRRDLVSRFPDMAALAHILSIAVNAEYADDSVALHTGDEVAVIPPVSGGCDVRNNRKADRA
jgi:molybdopterin converting factor subunit 1